MENTQSKPSILPEEVLKMIHGHVHHEDKKQLYQESLQKCVSPCCCCDNPAAACSCAHACTKLPVSAACRWWKDYSHRKNDEEDMVADSLLYDERCHLPRTTAGPKQQPEPEVSSTAAAAAVAASKAAAGAATGSS